MAGKKVIATEVEIKTPDGICDCDFFRPEGEDPFPGIVMYTDIGGRRAVFAEMGKRLAADGFAVLVPNHFYRAGRTPLYQNFKFGDEKTTARMNELRPFMTAAGAEKDAHALVDFLARNKHVKGPIATVGYCMGGGLAMRTAAAEPDKVKTVVSFHGSNLATDAPDSPHTLAPKIKARMYFGFAIEDRTMPPEAVEKLKSALDHAGVHYEGEVYPGARHGWCVKDHSVYHEHQAEHAWHHMLDVLKGGSGGHHHH